MTAGRRAAKERGNGAGHSASTPRVAANDGGLITLDELRHLRALAAARVLRHGDEVLPIFERLDEECAARERQQSTLDRVRAIAGRA